MAKKITDFRTLDLRSLTFTESSHYGPAGFKCRILLDGEPVFFEMPNYWWTYGPRTFQGGRTWTSDMLRPSEKYLTDADREFIDFIERLNAFIIEVLSRGEIRMFLPKYIPSCQAVVEANFSSCYKDNVLKIRVPHFDDTGFKVVVVDRDEQVLYHPVEERTREVTDLIRRGSIIKCVIAIEGVWTAGNRCGLLLTTAKITV